MVEMLVNPISGAGKAFTKWAVKSGTKKFAKSKLLKYGGRVATDIIGSAGMSATTGAIRVGGDTLNRMSGNADWSVNDDGSIKFDGFSGGESAGKALAKAFGARTIENFSEFTGEYFVPLLGGASKFVSKGLSRIGLKGLSEVLTNMPASTSVKQVKKFMDKTQWHGPIGEFAEEQIGTILNAMTVGDSKLSDLTDGRQQLTTFLVCSAYGGFTSTVNSAAYVRDRIDNARKYNEAKNLLSAYNSYDKYANIINDINKADDDKLVSILLDIDKDNEVSQEFKRNAMLYAGRLKQKQFSTLADIKMQEDGLLSPEQQQEAEGLYQGYNLAEADLMTKRIITNNIRKQKKELGINYIPTLDEIKQMDSRGEDIEGYMSLYNANNLLEGLYSGMFDNVQNQKLIAGRKIDNLTNKETDNIILATTINDDTPAAVISGNLQFEEDNSIDFENSDDRVFINRNGRVQMIPTSELSEIKNISSPDEYKETAYNEIDSNYQRAIEDMTEPINVVDDNVSGVDYTLQDNEAPQLFRIDGKITSGEVQRRTPEGNNLVQFDAPVEIDGEKGQVFELTDEELQSMMIERESDVYAQKMQEIEELAKKDEFILSLPHTKNGRLDYDKFTPAQNFEYTKQTVDEQTAITGAREVVEGLNKRIAKTEGKLSKTIGNKKLAMRDELKRLQAERDEWISLIPKESTALRNEIEETENVATNPVNMQQRKSEKSKAKGKTPFQIRLKALEDKVSTINDRILFGIASGEYKFRWTDAKGSKGVGNELGLLGSQTERRSRIGILSNSGYTPETLAHHIWEETGMRLDDADIRNEIIDVLTTVTSRSRALEELESHLNVDEDAYYREEEESILAVLSLQEEMFNDLAAENVEYLLNLAKELGLSEQELNDVSNVFDLAERLNELEEINNEQKEEIYPGRNRENEVSDISAISAGETPESVEGTIGKRNGSSKEERNRAHDRDGETDHSNLTAEEQHVVDEVNAEIDNELNAISAEINHKKTELDATRKRIGDTYEKDNQTSLFDEKQSSDSLIDVPRDFSQTTVNNIIVPLKQEIDSLTDSLNELNETREKKVNDSLDDFRSQKRIFDEDVSSITKAEQEVNTNPSEAQKEAGNYKMGHIKIDGYDITIENPKGSKRKGVDSKGNDWSIVINNTYGYIKGTKGVDGDHIDVFLSDTPEKGNIYVVDQVNKDGGFDEHKVMYGFDSEQEAREAYLSNYEDGWTGLGSITEVSKDTFKEWINSSKRKTKPFSEYKLAKEKTIFPLTEEEYAEKRSKEILNEHPNADEVKSYNDAIDEYPSYIHEKIKSGELEDLYAKSSIGDRVKLGDIVKSAGFETSDISEKANQESSIKHNKYKKGDNVSIKFYDGTIVNGRVDTADNGKVSVRSFENNRVYNVDESRIVEKFDESDIRFRDLNEYTEEEQQIISSAKANDTYLKAPNGEKSNLNEKQWLQVRTNAVKDWFSYWEMPARIEKLRRSKPIEITGKEIEPSEDLKQYKKNALEYGKNLRGEYVNKDTGEKILFSSGNKNGGLKEVLQHDLNNIAHIRSIAAIPQIIENSVYIQSLKNEDRKKNFDVETYDYHVCGLKIGTEDYTVRVVIAKQHNGNRYYDHKLTEIEKGKLLDVLALLNKTASSGLSSTGEMGETKTSSPAISLEKQQNSPVSGIKDKRLLSILQTNYSKVLDANGEPMVVYHGSRSSGFDVFEENKLSLLPYYL